MLEDPPEPGHRAGFVGHHALDPPWPSSYTTLCWTPPSGVEWTMTPSGRRSWNSSFAESSPSRFPTTRTPEWSTSLPEERRFTTYSGIGANLARPSPEVQERAIQPPSARPVRPAGCILGLLNWRCESRASRSPSGRTYARACVPRPESHDPDSGLRPLRG